MSLQGTDGLTCSVDLDQTDLQEHYDLGLHGLFSTTNPVIRLDFFFLQNQIQTQISVSNTGFSKYGI